MKYVIEKNVTLPVYADLPFNQMVVGDSFLLDSQDKNKLTGIAARISAGKDFRFSFVRCGDQYRCFKIKRQK